MGDYTQGGLKPIDIKSKFSSLHLSWVRRLFGENFHPWKNIPLKLLNEKYSQNIFYPNSQISLTNVFPKFYHQMATAWSSLHQEPVTCNQILSQLIWYNKYLKIDKQPIKKIFSFPLFVGDLVNECGIVPWVDFRQKFDLTSKEFFKWIQIVKSIPKKWKDIISRDSQGEEIFKNQHLNFNARILPLEKLTSKQIYIVFMHKLVIKPTSQSKIIEKIGHSDFNWAEVYLLGRFSAIDTFSRNFHFRNTHNIIFLNEKLFKCNLHTSPLCSFCHLQNENIAHLFFQCKIRINLWKQLQEYLKKFNIELPNLTIESAFLGFPNFDFLINHILIIFKMSLFICRDKEYCSLNQIKKVIKNTMNIENNITYLNQVSKSKNERKWAKLKFI